MAQPTVTIAPLTVLEATTLRILTRREVDSLKRYREIYMVVNKVQTTDPMLSGLSHRISELEIILDKLYGLGEVAP